MRAAILVTLCACADPPRPPPQRPADPGGIAGCHLATSLDSNTYHCNWYVVLDGTATGGSIHDVEAIRVAYKRSHGLEPTIHTRTLKGAYEASLIEYIQDNLHSFDFVATTPVETKLRFVICHVTWFADASLQEAREATCARTIGLLLQRPAPVVQEGAVECAKARQHLDTLPGHPDSEPELADESERFAERCTPRIAACAVAAKSFVEAKACR